MENMLEKIRETVDFIHSRAVQQKREESIQPQFGIILGTGLGNLAEEIDIEFELSYDDIPNFPISTVESHHGRLIFGRLSGKKVVAMQGRFHYYEGYSMQEVTFPVRVMKFLGIERLFISNAAGGLNPDMQTGDLMILRDHINLLPEHPLRGKNYNELGPRFPDLLKTYDQELVKKGLEIAKQHNYRCSAGVYVVIQGPALETPAEYKYLNIIGGDAVGMSTVPEALVAKHMELPVFAMSVITDLGYPLEVIKETTVEDVIAVAKEAEPKLTKVIKELIGSL